MSLLEIIHLFLRQTKRTCLFSSFNELPDIWKTVLDKIPADLIKMLALSVQEFFKSSFNFVRSVRSKSCHKSNWHPLHMVAESGHLELFKYVVEKTGDQNPIGKFTHYDSILGGQICRMENHLVIVHELTPFHLAASHGHFEICQYIINNIEDKNPGNGWTPLHEAAKKGHFAIVKLIIDNLTEKNPRDRNGHTPLHMSAMNGHLDICQLIPREIIENNPKVK